jgi:hypothetical protein
MTVDEETYRVLEWRTLQLERAGLPLLEARDMANTPVDLEYACRIIRQVLASGSPYSLAVKILL